jgi:hypothetical protein
LAPLTLGPVLVRRALIAIVVGLLAIGTLVLARRFAGALTRDLPTGLLLLTAIGSTATVYLVRRKWFGWHRERADGHPLTRLDRLVTWGGSLALWLLAIGCCFPGNRNVEWLIWLPLLIGDQFWRQSCLDGGDPAQAIDPPIQTPPPGELQKHAASSPSGNGPTGCGSSNGTSAPGLVPAATQPFPADSPHLIVQQLFRIREENGQESIYGTVRADFAQGQRHATLHVGFCPPLGDAPQVEVEPCNFPEANVRVVQSLAHGVRLDIRLREPAEEACHVSIDLAARAEAGCRSPVESS